MALTAIILCGGKGQRLRPLTLKTPKPLIKINKKSILEIILEHLSISKLENVVLATGYKSFKFKKFKKKNLKIHLFKLLIQEMLILLKEFINA